MEAVSNPIFPSRFIETPHILQSPPPSLIRAAFRRDGFLKINENLKPQRCSKFGKETMVSISGKRVRAVTHEISDGGEDEGTSGNRFGLIPGEEDWFDSNSSPDECKERGADESSETAIHFVSGSGMGGGSRAGLFRTPISGGVQSATEDIAYILKSNLSPDECKERGADESSETAIHFVSGSGMGGGSRAGLFRTPISGGVQSATSAHDLPRPALAVRNLMEQARFAHLCTVMSRMHHRRAGYPFGSLVDFAPDSMGHPIFSFSPLAIHTRNLLADSRCTLVVQIPGWSGLSNARVTIFGDVFPLPSEQQEWAHKQYIAKHQQGPSQQWGNFYYFRMQNISDIYFIGGFGTVAWVDVMEYETLQPDKIAVDGGEQNLKELNAIFSKPLKNLLSSETEVDDAALISIDSKGTDIRVRQGAQFNIQRLSFEVGHGVETLEEAKEALNKLISKGARLRTLHNKI